MSSPSQGLIRDGGYAKKQIFCRSRIISWSHSSRFQVGRELVRAYAGARLIDYGCGDGTFLALVHDLFPQAVGADVDPNQTAECARRLAAVDGLRFVLTPSLRGPAYDGSFGVVTCMEVLEHCVENTLVAVLADLRRLVADNGRVIVSVPIETGPTLALKQFVRLIAGWRRLGDYQYTERYTLGEFVRMLLAGEWAAIPRPSYGSQPYHGHKGFNWRSLRRRLRGQFEVERTLFSPLGWSRGCLSSQVWFVCKPLLHTHAKTSRDDRDVVDTLAL